MAAAFVNFYASLDKGGFGRGAQAFEGAASQLHQPNADVGASAALATKIVLDDATNYAEICATSGDVFACILASDATEADLTAGRVRLRQDDMRTLGSAYAPAASRALFVWAV